MFVALVPGKSGKDGIRDFLMDTINPKHQTVSYLRAQGTKLCMIKTKPMTKQKHWEAVYNLAQNYKNALLLPRDLEIPPDIPLKRYEPKKFISHVMTGTMIDVLEKTKIPLYKRTIGMIDMDARYQTTAHELIKYASTVRILTRNTEKYQLFAQQMLELYGAVVILCEHLESLQDSIFILNFDNYYGTKNVTLTCPIFSTGVFETGTACTVYTDFHVEIPTVLKEELPEILLGAIAETDLLGAFYEFNGVREFGKLKANYVKIGNKIVYFDELATKFQ